MLILNPIPTDLCGWLSPCSYIVRRSSTDRRLVRCLLAARSSLNRGLPTVLYQQPTINNHSHRSGRWGGLRAQRYPSIRSLPDHSVGASAPDVTRIKNTTTIHMKQSGSGQWQHTSGQEAAAGQRQRTSGQEAVAGTWRRQQPSIIHITITTIPRPICILSFAPGVAMASLRGNVLWSELSGSESELEVASLIVRLRRRLASNR